MTRVLAFGSPYLLGFDQIERMAERLAKAGAESYPPYNIEQTSEADFRIALAVAGFAPADLSVTVEDNRLVHSRQAGRGRRQSYLHRGIAAPAVPALLRPGGRHGSGRGGSLKTASCPCAWRSASRETQGQDHCDQGWQ